MKQVNKFYLASFLKNQTYFVPIIVLFFQDLGLNFSEIFWIFTIGSVFSFLIEIPTGIFADIYGKRRGILISKFFIFVAFISFALSFNFWSLLLSNLIYELGKAFRSGTETAYVYSYLDQTKYTPSYTYVKANQKFYARISESIGTALGGLIAYNFGFAMAFWAASIPALVNFLQTISWIQLDDCKKSRIRQFKYQIEFSKNSFLEAIKKSYFRQIIFNVALFSTAVLSLDKFVQPYMQNVGVELKYIGFIYSFFLFLLAWVARYADFLENKFGATRTLNFLSILAIFPLILLGFGVNSLWGIALFFFVLMLENLRSPIANTLFYQLSKPDNRATMGSILELFKSSIRLIFFPIIGHMADIFSMQVAMFGILIIILFSVFAFWIKNYKPYIKIQ